MLTVHMDTSRLSIEELANVGRVLRGRCEACIEQDVPECCKHPEEVQRFLSGLAEAVDAERERRERRDRELALGVDPVSGEWVAGA